MFIKYALSDPFLYVSWICLVAFSICCHEYAHAFTALRAGDTTAAERGHLTLNPLVQMKLPSLVMLALFGIAWGAVPVSLTQLRSARSRAAVALAGPLTNLALCIFFSLLMVAARAFSTEKVIQFFFVGGAVNGALFVLNMLPIPVFDGFAVLSAFNSSLEQFAQKHASTVFIVFVLLLWNSPLGDLIFDAGYSLQALFVGFWSGLIGLAV